VSAKWSSMLLAGMKYFHFVNYLNRGLKLT
jgi:hypothetical protein